MKRFSFTAFLCLASLAVALALVGCGGSSSTATVSQGVEAVGVMSAGGSSAMGFRVGPPPGYELLNPLYKDAYLVPSAISVAVAKLELLRSEDDENPYVVFDTGADLSLAKVIDLLNVGDLESFGGNTEYPPAGTYTHIRMTLVYLDQVIEVDIGDGQGVADHHCRVYASTVGTILDGDVLMDIDGQFSWLQGDGFFPITGARPAQINGQGSEVVQFFGWAEDNAESPDPYIFTVALGGEGMVVPASPTGKYTVTVDFDVTQSPEIPGSTGMFIFDDANENGLWEAAISIDEGGDAAGPEAEGGDSLWSPLPPLITVTFEQAV